MGVVLRSAQRFLHVISWAIQDKPLGGSPMDRLDIGTLNPITSNSSHKFASIFAKYCNGAGLRGVAWLVDHVVPALPLHSIIDIMDTYCYQSAIAQKREKTDGKHYSTDARRTKGTCLQMFKRYGDIAQFIDDDLSGHLSVQSGLFRKSQSTTQGERKTGSVSEFTLQLWQREEIQALLRGLMPSQIAMEGGNNG